MSNIVEKAKLWRSFLIEGDRVTVSEGAPEEFRDAIYGAHNGMLPDDYIYANVLEVLDAIIDTEAREAEDIFDYLAEPMYYKEMRDWIASSDERVYMVDEVIKSYGDACPTLFDLIALAIVQEKEAVAFVIMDHLQQGE